MPQDARLKGLPGGACHYNCPFPDSSASANMSEDRIDVEDQIICFTVLSQVTIDPSAELQRLRVSNRLQRCNDRTNWAEFVKGFGGAMLASRSRGYLPISRRDIVSHGHAEDVVHRIFLFRQIFHVFGNDDSELSFVVQFLRLGIDRYIFKWACQSIWEPPS